MKKTSLNIEFVIIGFLGLFFITVCFCIIEHYSFKDLILFLNENFKSVSLLGTICSYLIGLISHRMGHYLNLNAFKKLSKKVFKEDLITEDWNNKNYLNILQFGSDNINERLVYIESLIKIFKISGFYLFFTGLVIPIWLLQHNISAMVIVFVSLLFLGFGFSCFLSLGLQVKRRNLFISEFQKINIPS